MRSKRQTGLDHRAYRRAKNKLRKESSVCHLCGKKIDSRSPADGGPEYNSPDEWTADHVDARSTGGHLLGLLKAAHRSCNSSRGAKPMSAVKTLPTSRDW